MQLGGFRPPVARSGGANLFFFFLIIRVITREKFYQVRANSPTIDLTLVKFDGIRHLAFAEYSP